MHRPDPCATNFSRKLSRGNGTPFYRDALDAVERIFEKIARANQREAQIVFAFGAECCSGDRGNAGFLEQDPLDFFGGKSRVFDVDPGVESAFGRVAPEAG